MGSIMEYTSALQAEAEPVKREDHIRCCSCGASIDYEKLLSRHGPEGLYIIADELMKIANNDMDAAQEMIRNAICQKL